MTTPLLEVKGLKKYFPIRKGFFARTVGQVRAVDGVSFSVQPGEVLGLVGESGCGKTTAGRALLRLRGIIVRYPDHSDLHRDSVGGRIAAIATLVLNLVRVCFPRRRSQ